MAKLNLKSDDVAALIASMSRVRDLCEKLDLFPLVDVPLCLRLIKHASEHGTEAVNAMLMNEFGTGTDTVQ
jgi:hypothetical protein